MPIAAAEEAIHLIKMMMSKIKSSDLQSMVEEETPGEDFDLLQKKIWVKEIATSWMNHWLAAKTEAGKKALVELFKYMENMELTQAKNTGAPVYDFSGLWEELGVADEMRGVNSAK